MSTFARARPKEKRDSKRKRDKEERQTDKNNILLKLVVSKHYVRDNTINFHEKCISTSINIYNHKY